MCVGLQWLLCEEEGKEMLYQCSFPVSSCLTPTSAHHVVTTILGSLPPKQVYIYECSDYVLSYAESMMHDVLWPCLPVCNLIWMASSLNLSICLGPFNEWLLQSTCCLLHIKNFPSIIQCFKLTVLHPTISDQMCNCVRPFQIWTDILQNKFAAMSGQIEISTNIVSTHLKKSNLHTALIISFL